MQDRYEPLVSVQQSTAADAVAGHLAWGILIDRDSVMVHGPLGWLYDLSVRFEVLLASKRPDNSGVVERIGVHRAEVFGQHDHADNAVALLELVHPAQHHHDNRTRRFESEAMASHLAEHHDVWLALEDLDVVSRDLRTLRPEVLARVAEWETIGRRELIYEQRSGSIVEIRWCKIFRACMEPPPKERSDRWW